MTRSSVPGIHAGRPVLSLHSVSELSSNSGRSPSPLIPISRSWLPARTLARVDHHGPVGAEHRVELVRAAGRQRLRPHLAGGRVEPEDVEVLEAVAGGHQQLLVGKDDSGDGHVVVARAAGRPRGRPRARRPRPAAPSTSGRWPPNQRAADFQNDGPGGSGGSGRTSSGFTGTTPGPACTFSKMLPSGERRNSTGRGPLVLEAVEQRLACAADGLVDGLPVDERPVELAGELHRGAVADRELHGDDRGGVLLDEALGHPAERVGACRCAPTGRR